MSAFSQALDDLRRAQKSSKGVSLYSRYVNRPIGRVFAAMCFALRMTPNQVTATSAAVTLLGLIVLVSGEPAWWRGVTVAALLVIGFALDSADGQVARLTGTGSPRGEWLDHVVDSAKIVSVHGSVLVVAVLYLDVGAWAIILPLLFQIVNVTTFFGGELHRSLSSSKGAATSASGAPSTLRAVGLLPADYGVLSLSFVLLGWSTGFFILYALLLVANIGVGGLLLRKWFRSLD